MVCFLNDTLNLFLFKRPQYVQCPKTVNDWKKVAQDFEVLGLPHCLGAIDGKRTFNIAEQFTKDTFNFLGKHVRIKKPQHSGSDFFNYKKHFSVVLMAVVDAKAKFLYINVGAQGSNNDAMVLNSSRFAKKVNDGSLSLPPPEPIQCNDNTNVILPYYFIGDGAFGLKSHLITPYGGT